MAFAGLLAGLVVIAQGLPDRASELVRRVDARYKADMNLVRPQLKGPCFLAPGEKPSKFAPRCFDPQLPVGTDEMTIWGDSYARALWFGTAKAPEFEQYKIRQATAASCPPLRDPPIALNTACGDVARYTLIRLAAMRPQTIVLFARWQYYAKNGTDVAGEIGDAIRALNAAKHRVIVVGPIPEWTPTLPQRLFQASFLRGGYVPDRLDDSSHAAGIELDDRLAAAAAKAGAAYVSLFKAWCNSAGCSTLVYRDGRAEMVVYDHGHLTVMGAEWIASRVLANLNAN
jgi:hypothetical protein